MRTDDQSIGLWGKAARLYYEHGLTHAEIGEMLGLSRVKVTRVLAEARSAGIVEITIHSDERPFADLESALERRFGLHSAWVCPPLGANGERLEGSLGVVGAEALASVLPRVATIAVGLSNAVAAAVARLARRSENPVDVLPLAGSSGGRSSQANPHALASTLAHALGGTAYHLPAPLLATTPGAAESIRADEQVRTILSSATDADAMVVGIGSNVRLAQSLRRSVSEAEFKAVLARGAVGDVSARFFDEGGESVPGVVDDRVIGLTLAQMRAIPLRIGIAGGQEKHGPLFTALATGLVNVVVTDSESARAALAQPGP